MTLQVTFTSQKTAYRICLPLLSTSWPKLEKPLIKRPVFNAAFLDRALVKAVKFAQPRCFRAAVDLLSRKSPDDSEAFLKRWATKANSSDERRRVNDLKSLRNLRPCVGHDILLRVDGRLENADLPTDTKHPVILPGRHPLTRSIVLDEHCKCGYAGSSYTLMKTRHLHNLWNRKCKTLPCELRKMLNT